jgi:hypothetical protein
MPRWQARRADTRHHLKKPWVLKAGRPRPSYLKHGTDDIWYIKYFIALWNPNRVKWYQTDAYANEDAKTLTTVMVRSQKACHKTVVLSHRCWDGSFATASPAGCSLPSNTARCTVSVCHLKRRHTMLLTRSCLLTERVDEAGAGDDGDLGDDDVVRSKP